MQPEMTAPHLHLFMTDGMSLQAWEEGGLLARELALYQRLMAAGLSVTIVSYGGPEEQGYAARFPGLQIVCNRWQVPQKLYRAWLNHRYRGRGTWLAKSNQTPGAATALRAARRGHAPFIARCGYLFSEFNARAHGPQSPQARQARALEARVFTAATQVVVTTSAMQSEIVARYQLPPEKISVIPNYVDTALFTPAPRPAAARLCFIGRLEVQKNPLALVEAVAGLEAELVMIGEGSLRPEIEALAAQRGVALSLPGNLPNTELPAQLQNSAIFVLPSLYEGHPKTLVEAMACGLPVLGTDVPGIRELIRHGETGWLCAPEPASIRAALQTLLGDSALRTRLGQAARAYAVENFSLDRVAQLELALIRQLTGWPE